MCQGVPGEPVLRRHSHGACAWDCIWLSAPPRVLPGEQVGGLLQWLNLCLAWRPGLTHSTCFWLFPGFCGALVFPIHFTDSSLLHAPSPPLLPFLSYVYDTSWGNMFPR